MVTRKHYTCHAKFYEGRDLVSAASFTGPKGTVLAKAKSFAKLLGADMYSLELKPEWCPAKGHSLRHVE